jgi:hypothetical protein
MSYIEAEEFVLRYCVKGNLVDNLGSLLFWLLNETGDYCNYESFFYYKNEKNKIEILNFY